MSVDLFPPAAANADLEANPQRRAADPQLSAFVTANAGSGKTKTLIDRVARLLLAGAEPEAILCVTYTKAAASEMQRRLYGVLGGWSVASDASLAEQLASLDDRAYAPAELSRARGLFAKALETPGGLKIQTIHAFCEKLLRRFPLEAEVSPGFRVMDDTDASAIAAAARGLLARHALIHEDATAAAYARFAVKLDFQRFEAMFAEFEARRGDLDRFFEREGGLVGAIDWVQRTVGLSPGETAEMVASATMARLDRAQWRACAEVLNAGSATDQKYAGRMRAVAIAPEDRFDEALGIFFTAGGQGTPATWLNTAAVVKRNTAVQTYLLLEQARLYEAREQMRAAVIAEETADALRLAAAYLAAYHEEKRGAGGLDFADLIKRTCKLLSSRPAAAWVLFKLDGGIDHILVDEAQDTAPDQWRIVNALTEEFFAGAGVRADRRLARNLFVVGDVKQSIYSFQGARPELLRRNFEFHRDRATGAGLRFEQIDLLTSYRSTPEVLTFVDAVFAPAGLSAFIQREPVRHLPQRLEHPGCVDVWDLEVEAPNLKRDAWTAPLDEAQEGSATRRLAKRIAREIAALIRRGDRVFDKDDKVWRPARPGDVLILVRRRKALFEEILRALKHEGVPVAGADRLALSAHIVFDDLMAAARFALAPRDELNLAALLKSPFCNLDDEALYALAHGRGAENLWSRLERLADSRDDWRAAHALLADLLVWASGPPFEFYARLLQASGADGRSMRQRLLNRLGSEAEDAIQEFLNQTLAAESRGARDLESLAAGLSGLDILVKREMEGAGDAVRVMTAHGAKGLEAPIVFLPETTIARGAQGSRLLPVEIDDDNLGFLWSNAAAFDCEATKAAREARAAREEAETFRLLYVALTRARDRLVLCGRINAKAKAENIKGWWGAIRDALNHAGIEPRLRQVSGEAGAFARFGDDPLPMAAAPTRPARTDQAPAWTRTTADAESRGRFASPSVLDESLTARAASPLATAGGIGRFRRGDLIHRLLQLLPDLPADARPAAAARLLAVEADLTEDQRMEMAQAALAVLSDPQFAEVFGPGSRAEVALAGGAAALPEGLTIAGRVDRLVVLPDRVLVADFKTNRPSPPRIEAADPTYLRQMAIYAAVLAEIFPDRRVEAAIVWTDGPKLMTVPENLLAETLAALRRAS
ncbi:double-strand break repair helicase AddA [Phenylobacterium immobile]|uniref:double-strand break repair helicase AddA n=1 Tax=Phenylobacterium immobile TaxID=21 RepID=UPI000A833665|nr:double-strand break repair helicase AddA [Phenylobacterium immobile]